MISILFFSMLLINMIIILCKRKSDFFAFLLYVCIFIVFAGNNRTGFSDLTYYRARYEAMTNQQIFTDIGYSYIADYLSSIGVPFNMFLALIFAFSSALIFLAIRKSKINYNLLLVLYSLYYLFFDMEVIRLFIATSFAIYALYHLYNNRMVMFICFILLAFLFHKIIIFILPFGFMYKMKNKEKIFNICAIVLAILTVINFFFRNFFDIFSFVLNYFSESMVESINFYASAGTRYGSLLYYLYYLYNLGCSYCLAKIVDNDFKEHRDLKKLTNFLRMKCLYTVVFLPLITSNTTFFRFILIDCKLIFIVAAIVIPAIQYNKKVILYQTGSRNHRSKSGIYVAGFFLFILLWVIEWWMLRINVISMFEAVSNNIFN